jgi:hypothetical protein
MGQSADLLGSVDKFNGEMTGRPADASCRHQQQGQLRANTVGEQASESARTNEHATFACCSEQ